MQALGCHAAIFAIALATFAATAEAGASELRRARQAEIEKYVSRNADLTELSNGYSYKSGSRNGYKFSDGSVCVRFPSGGTDCVKVLTDGKKFYMVTKDGARSSF
ncbi:hypothetical protein [Rhizobium sp. 007]|uniref:hypothetical protein n=1 Tax=Rhizobium sp. 007 TaxID=2785056 RepID=UPI0018903624|nr:hypothetical protein [Rhizobium sp. 007]QPB22371.1 hypothetical protein ISN39_22335 [Rhizobium sp. 007]